MRRPIVPSLLPLLWGFLVVPLVPATPSDATEIAGKWGIGIGTGDLIGSRPEAAIIRGKSARTAWILDLGVGQRSDSEDDRFESELPDTLIIRDRGRNLWSVNAGPRIRRFLRPAELFSPYFDLYGRFSFFWSASSVSEQDFRERQIGGEVGVALGAEHFFVKWPISLAAHSRIGYFRYTHGVLKINGVGATRESEEDSGEWSIGISPALQVRVYF
jgi:hypothetical protein